MTSPAEDVQKKKTRDAIEQLDIPLNVSYSPERWDKLFETFLGLLSHPEYDVWDRTIRVLVRALEVSQRSKTPEDQTGLMATRVEQIFEAIVAQVPRNDQIFVGFCSAFQFLGRESPYQALVLEWLADLRIAENHPMLSKDAIVAAQIFFGAYDTTWNAAGETLLQMLDHEDLNLRACAAYQIGQFYSNAFYDGWIFDLIYGEAHCEQKRRSMAGMPPMNEIMQLIRNKEIQRPGVAGAFWGAIPKEGIDVRAWLLDILEHSPEPEPYSHYFPRNLAFEAHERFSRDPEAIRSLIAIGRSDIAVFAATSESEQINDLEPLLVELGYQEDSEIVRLASWHLAYYYHRLHPKGAELGYVECIDDVQDIDVFLVHRLEANLSSIYAVVIYPKDRDQPWSRSVAQKWVDQIFPTSVRGEPRDDLPSLMSHYYRRGYIAYQPESSHNEDDPIDHVIIGYRSKAAWNPRDFL